MFGNNYSNFGFTTMPTATQPFGYPLNPYQQQQPQMPMHTQTNIVYVSGLEEVKAKQLMPNSEMMFADNDKPILYKKIVDSKGQYEVKMFKISPYEPAQAENAVGVDNLAGYAKIADLDSLRASIEEIKQKIGL